MSVETITIGNVKIEKTAALAPMASVADRVYRTLCKQGGASYLVSEMVSSKGLCYGDKKTDTLCSITPLERPMAIQLFGEDPEFMGRATSLISRFEPDIIDINMGCPVPKVVNNQSGSALMKDPERAFKIAKAVVENASCPVTAKIRSGWDENSINAVPFAQGLEAAGVSAIAVHARTRKQFYSGSADWDIIRQVKNSVNCVVIGNGDVRNALECEKMYKETGCDLVMIGRGSYGRPWVFEQVRRYFDTGEIMPEPTIEKRMETMLLHAKMLCDELGEEHGMREARKHVIWYIKGLPNSSAIRNGCSTLVKYDVLQALADDIIENYRTRLTEV